MPFPIFGLAGGMLATRLGFAGAQTFKHALFRSPLIQGGQFGVGYTGGAYLGYGTTNTGDPFGLHKPKYRHNKQSLGLPRGNYGGYRSRRYRSRYGRRYRSRYGYRRRSYYRRYY